MKRCSSRSGIEATPVRAVCWYTSIRQYGIGYVAKRLARRYGIRVYKVRVLALLDEASSIAGPNVSANTVFDYAHILAARKLGAKTFVTSDRASCRRAIRLSLCCPDHREGREECPTHG